VGYFVRAFTGHDARTPLRKVLEWAAAHGAELALESGASIDLDTPDWRQAVVVHARRRFVVEATRPGDDGDLLADEVAEFADQLGELPDSPERQRVLECLRGARAVVAAQLFRGRDDPGLDAAVTFLQFFVETDGGMIQADEVGFFEGDELILELD
jgi:hypothetical protein